MQIDELKSFRDFDRKYVKISTVILTAIFEKTRKEFDYYFKDK